MLKFPTEGIRNGGEGKDVPSFKGSFPLEGDVEAGRKQRGRDMRSAWMELYQKPSTINSRKEGIQYLRASTEHPRQVFAAEVTLSCSGCRVCIVL